MMRLIFAVVLFVLSSMTFTAHGQTTSYTKSYSYDLVMLFPGGSANPNEGVEVRGSETHTVIRDGARYLFSSAETKALFEKNPRWYLPGGDGLCLLGWHRRASGAPHKGLLPPPGDPRARTYVLGRWFLHGSKDAEREFEQDPYTIEPRASLAMEWRANKLLSGGQWQR